VQAFDEFVHSYVQTYFNLYALTVTKNVVHMNVHGVQWMWGSSKGVLWNLGWSSPDRHGCLPRAGLLLQELYCSGIKADFYGTVAVVSFT